jgi:hypothetical protein
MRCRPRPARHSAAAASTVASAGVRQRQLHHELRAGGPAGLLAADHAAALLDGPERRGQADAVAVGLGGEERVEDPVEHLRRHARAVVRHAQFHPGRRPGFLDALQLHGNAGALAPGHGVNGVEEQVQDDAA